MGDEIMTIEGLHGPERKTKMARSVLYGLKEDLFDASKWKDGLMAAGGGGAAILVTDLVLKRIPFERLSVEHASKLKSGAQALLGAALAILAEPYVGKAAAHGMAGGAGGLGFARLANEFLPAEFKAGLGNFGQLTSDEQDFLRQYAPARGLENVSAESEGYLGQVSVEEGSLLNGCDEEDEMYGLRGLAAGQIAALA